MMAIVAVWVLGFFIPAWVAFALTGNERAAAVAAFWGGFGTVEATFLLLLVLAISDFADGGELLPCVGSCGFLGALLGSAVCLHYSVLAGAGRVDLLLLSRSALAGAVAGLVACPAWWLVKAVFFMRRSPGKDTEKVGSQRG